ncbi:FAD-dependent oxidoreductase [Brachybacterium kimchii]|uniref:FAD-binding oxidoreductase n=1 Tax=Brachybacterium kimchii TaxID=2942909 RepID=A0ABY4N9F4_9MICO|nr:FAD-binding oxidoreductase [Brachybacterium kimchii]UQN31188.1 FAD-binding oxidoreductase [Brachybacterium kimchii]
MRSLNRRELLGGGIGLAAATAATLGSTAPVLAEGSAKGLGPKNWEALDDELSGSVLLPDDDDYATDKKLFNPAFDSRSPTAVIRPRSRGDVERVMEFVRVHGLKVSARGGGHSYVGASAADDTVVLDLRDYHGISYSSSSKHVTIQAGADLYSVHEALSAHDRMIPTGTCPTVGAVGLALGGGIGVDTRRYGTTSDSLVSAHVVLPDGRTVTASADSRPDLFWALRGGGGGLNGVVTDLTFATHPLHSQASFAMAFADSDAEEVITGWASWLKSSDGSRWASVKISTDGHGTMKVNVIGVADADDARDAVNSLAKATGARPDSATYKSRSHMDLVDYLGGGSSSDREVFAAGTDVLRSVGSSTAEAIVAAVKKRSTAGQKTAAILDPLDGAVHDVERSGTAFPWRSQTASLQWYASLTSTSGLEDARAWVEASHEGVDSASSGGYVNYLEPGDSAERCFGENAAKLARIREHYDPSHRITCGLEV